MAKKRLGAALSSNFTDREWEVLREWVNGKTDAAIAESLFMSVTRVKQHILRILEKTQFSNRTELAIQAREAAGIANGAVEVYKDTF